MVELVKARLENANFIHDIKKEAFLPLLEKYQDYDMSPACEPLEKTIRLLNDIKTDYYLINYNKNTVGAIRIHKAENNFYRVGQIFILPKHQGYGIGQETFKIIFNFYSDAKKWILDTIKEEVRNCYLYEKLGFKRLDTEEKINEKLTIIRYEKVII